MQAELKRKTNKECQSVVTCQPPAVQSETLQGMTMHLLVLTNSDRCLKHTAHHNVFVPPCIHMHGQWYAQTSNIRTFQMSEIGTERRGSPGQMGHKRKPLQTGSRRC